MKNLVLIIFTLTLFLVISCKKKENKPIDNIASDSDSIQNNLNIPSIQTLAPTEVSHTFSVVGGDSLKPNQDTIVSIGICWGTSSSLNISNSKTIQQNKIEKFSCKIQNLEPNTTYYYRAYATGKNGTGYGQVKSFTTLQVIYTKGNGVNDINGNFYRSVIIGQQEWMIDNLEVTKYNDGTEIPLITNQTNWYTNKEDAYCIYNNDIKNITKYGLLYNGYSVITNKLCPTNWHVPSKQEWEELIEYCGGSNIAGGKLKEINYDYWAQPNTGASNITGFIGVGGGLRTNDGNFYNLNKNGYWWTSTEVSNASYPMNHYVTLTYSNTNAYMEGYYKQTGLSVRCIKDK